MECPFCSIVNLPGVDQCACCGADLTNPAAMEEVRTPLERDLLCHPLGDLAIQSYAVISPNVPVRDAVRTLIKTGHPCAVVVDRDRIVGIFTERDVLLRLAGPLDTMTDAPISDFMTPNPETLRHSDAVVFGLNRMMVGGYRHIPIERDGKLCGVVSVRDVLKYLVQRLDEPEPAVAVNHP